MSLDGHRDLSLSGICMDVEQIVLRLCRGLVQERLLKSGLVAAQIATLHAERERSGPER